MSGETPNPIDTRERLSTRERKRLRSESIFEWEEGLKKNVNSPFFVSDLYRKYYKHFQTWEKEKDRFLLICYHLPQLSNYVQIQKELTEIDQELGGLSESNSSDEDLSSEEEEAEEERKKEERKEMPKKRGTKGADRLEEVDNPVQYPVGLHTFELDELQKLFMVPDGFFKKLMETQAFWVSFGKKDSHIIRKNLFDLMAKYSLTAEERYMVYHTCSFMKKKDRIVESLKRAEKTILRAPWYKNVLSFFEYHTCTFPEDEDEDTIATIHIPQSNPGLSLLAHFSILPAPMKTLEYFLERQEAVQLNLDKVCMEIVKVNQMNFWNNTIRKTSHRSNRENFQKRLEEKVQAPGSSDSAPVMIPKGMFDEEIFNTQAADMYRLLGKDFKEIPPKNVKEGYSKEEIGVWLAAV